MSLASKLDIPLVFQEDDFSCVPICIKMVLDFISEQNPEGYIPEIDFNEISKTVGTDELGTALENVKNINKKLEKAVPSIEFEDKMNCSLDEIENEIQKGNPVIAWIKNPFHHSIVLTGLDKESLVIYCNDSQKGKVKMEMGEFMSAWKRMDNVLIKVKIGEKIQRIIPEFAEKGEKEEEEQ
jgi:ABC-type bacteriocin/lantibiotic exporter with double-glycine peptidase domain